MCMPLAVCMLPPLCCTLAPVDCSNSRSRGHCPTNNARYGLLLSLHISLYFCMSAEVCNSIASAPDAWSAHEMLEQHWHDSMAAFPIMQAHQSCCQSCSGCPQ